MRPAATIPLLSLLLGANAFAQSVAPDAPSEEQQTIVGNRADDTPTTISGWFVAPTFGTTGFGGNLAYTPGLRGGIYLNRRVGLGVALNGLATDHSDFSRHEARDVGAYGGFLVQYILQSNRLVHTSFEATLGSGRWCTVASDEQDECTGRRFLAFEPGVNVELNVARHLRIATGVGYRFAVAGTGEGPTSRDMSSLVARTSLVFGSF